MVTVSDFLENLRAIDFKSLTKTIVEDNQKAIVDLNRRDQIFDRGIDALGNKLPTYAASTQSIFDTKDNGSDMGRHKPKGYSYNLFWTGQSYYGFYAYVKGLNLYITTDTRGRKLLIQNGGENIFGLTLENQNKVNWQIIAPKINEEVRRKLL